MAEIKKYSAKKPLSGSELKEFRHYVKQLKLPKTDARSARPYFVRGGKTLAELVNKHRAELKVYKTAAPAPKKLPLRQPISIRDFPHKHNSLAGVLRDLEENFEEINRLKKPDEKFAFEIDGIKSYAIFYDIRDLAEYLSESAGIQQVLHKRTKSQELFNALKIVRWNKSAQDWKPSAQKLSREQVRKRNLNRAGSQVKKRRKKK